MNSASTGGVSKLSVSRPRVRQPHPFVVLAGCALYLASLGWIDRATGFELGLAAFYTAPVAVVAWHLGQRPGIVVAFIASLIWYLADQLAGDHYSNSFYGFWNTAMHFGAFLVNAITFAKMRASHDRRCELENLLAQAHQQLADMVTARSIDQRNASLHSVDAGRAETI